MSKEKPDIHRYLNIIICDNEELKTHILEFIKQNFKHDLLLNLVKDENIVNTINTIVDFCRISNLLIDDCINIINNQLDAITKIYILKIIEDYRSEKREGKFNFMSRIKLMLIEDVKNKKFDKKKAKTVGIEIRDYFLLRLYFTKRKKVIEDEFYLDDLDDLIKYDYTQFNLEDYYSYEDFDIFEIDNLDQDNILKKNYQESNIFYVLEKEAQEEFERFINSDTNTNKKNIRLESPNSITHPFSFNKN